MAEANSFFNKLLNNNLEKSVWQNKLNGVWQDQWGWDFINQPNRDTPGASDFQMRSDIMRETIRFKNIGFPQNIGVEGEVGTWHAISYEIDIRNPNQPDPNNSDGQGIHHEMGHFLLHVDEDQNNDAIPHQDGRRDFGSNLSGVVIRQATIPRANSFMTHGILDIGSVAEVLGGDPTEFDNFYSPKTSSITSNPELEAKIDSEVARNQADVSAKNGPDILKLISFIKKVDDNQLGQLKPGTLDWVFAFRKDAKPSQMASGQRVGRPVTIGNLLSEFWIGDRVLDGNEIEILQYAQKVDIKFNNVDWPHVAINTLIKQ